MKDVNEKTVQDAEKRREEVEVTADKLREMSSLRAPAVKAKQQQQDRGLHIVPIEGENEEAAWNAAKWVTERKAQMDAVKARRAAEDQNTYLYFLKCRNPHSIDGAPAPAHGIYFTRRPDGMVANEDWYSRYKKRSQAWRGQEIECQVCLMMGIARQRLPYEWADVNTGTWIPDPRWVWKVPKDPQRAEIEGETRAFDLPYEAANTWRAEVEARLAKARQEGVLTNG